jgi:hypothetical protein
MAGLLNVGEPDAYPTGRPATETLYVRRMPYRNSAAKFWPGLADEVAEFFPDRPDIELSAPSGTPLSRRALFPEEELQRDLDRLMEEGRTLEDVLAELELTGLPAPVRLRLLSGGRVAHEQALPTDCLDNETFPYLVAWLLEWAEVPEDRWNAGSVEGRFSGQDAKRRRDYAMAFALSNEPIKEGLVQRTVKVTVSVAER